MTARECIACANLRIKDYPKHAREGLGRCAKKPGAYFVKLRQNQPCGTFEAAPVDKAKARRVWFAQQAQQ